MKSVIYIILALIDTVAIAQNSYPEIGTAVLNSGMNTSLVASASSLCQPGNVTFTASSSYGGTSPTFSWFVNGTLIATTSANVWVRNITSTSDVTVRLNSSGGTCISPLTANSNQRTVVLSASPTTVPVVQNTTAQYGNQVTLTASGAGANETYQWLLDGSVVG